MVYRVVSTKLSEEEHTALLDLCGQQGVSPSAFTRTVILERLKSDSQDSSQTEEKKEENVKQAEPIKAEEKKESNLSELTALLKKLAASKPPEEPRKESCCSLRIPLNH